MPYKDLNKQRECARRRKVERRKENPENERAKDRRYRLDHLEAMRAKGRVESAKYREANPDKIKERRRNYRAADAANQRVRRRKLVVCAEDRMYYKILRNDICAYCAGLVEHIDHIVPLDAGGGSSWNNLTASCASCNLSKGVKPLLVWMAERS